MYIPFFLVKFRVGLRKRAGLVTRRDSEDAAVPSRALRSWAAIAAPERPRGSASASDVLVAAAAAGGPDRRPPEALAEPAAP